MCVCVCGLWCLYLLAILFSLVVLKISVVDEAVDVGPPVVSFVDSYWRPANGSDIHEYVSLHKLWDLLLIQVTEGGRIREHSTQGISPYGIGSHGEGESLYHVVHMLFYPPSSGEERLIPAPTTV